VNLESYSYIDSLKPTGIVVRDFNNDTCIHIAVVFLINDSFGILFVYENGSQPYGITAGDFNNDGYSDIVGLIKLLII
jgi:hypothetical protein